MEIDRAFRRRPVRPCGKDLSMQRWKAIAVRAGGPGFQPRQRPHCHQFLCCFRVSRPSERGLLNYPLAGATERG